MERWASSPVQHKLDYFSALSGFPFLCWTARTFLKLLQLDLKAHPPGAPIVKIHLAAEPVRPRAAQNGLFLPPSPEPEKLELTLARIAGIVGEDKVGSLELLDTHRPGGIPHAALRAREPFSPQRHKPRKHQLVRIRAPLSQNINVVTIS